MICDCGFQFGLGAEVALHQVAEIQHDRAAGSSRRTGMIVGGVALLVLGLVITFGSIASGASVSIIALGPVLAGLGLALRGMMIRV